MLVHLKMNKVLIDCVETVEERGGERAARDVANLQAHEAGEAGGAGTGEGPSAQIPAGHLRPAQSQNGPAQVNGQRKHHHRHGQGNPSPHRLSLKATINLPTLPPSLRYIKIKDEEEAKKKNQGRMRFFCFYKSRISNILIKLIYWVR